MPAVRQRRLVRRGLIAVAAVLVAEFLAGSTSVPSMSAKAKAPKHVIIMISDGWGHNHIDAASFYRYGKAGG